MAKTLAQLKRDAKAGGLWVEMKVFHGETDVPERLRGKRQIVDADTVGIKIMTKEGKKSALDIESASLLEYTDDSITIYNAGLRELTDDEQRILAQWEQKRDKQQEEIDAITDGSTSFWMRKHFFTDAGYAYLLGYEKVAGKKLDHNTGKVFDNRIKGDICIQYDIICAS